MNNHALLNAYRKLRSDEDAEFHSNLKEFLPQCRSFPKLERFCRARIRHLLRDHEGAVRAYADLAREKVRSEDERIVALWCLNNLAALLEDCGRGEEALAAWEAAWDLTQSVGITKSDLFILANAGKHTIEHQLEYGAIGPARERIQVLLTLAEACGPAARDVITGSFDHWMRQMLEIPPYASSLAEVRVLIERFETVHKNRHDIGITGCICNCVTLLLTHDELVHACTLARELFDKVWDADEATHMERAYAVYLLALCEKRVQHLWRARRHFSKAAHEARCSDGSAELYGMCQDQLRRCPRFRKHGVAAGKGPQRQHARA